MSKRPANWFDLVQLVISLVITLVLFIYFPSPFKILVVLLEIKAVCGFVFWHARRRFPREE